MHLNKAAKLSEQSGPAQSLPSLTPVSVAEQDNELTVHASTAYKRSLSVIIAEDNEINQIVTKSFLEKYGHKVSLANNGKECLQLLDSYANAPNKKRPDIILMDIQMPEMSGVEATKAIRNRKDELSQIPILALTANAFPEQQAEYLAVGMNDCINKPITFEEFYGKIAAQLNLPIEEITAKKGKHFST